jgi:hypothetical protein
VPENPFVALCAEWDGSTLQDPEAVGGAISSELRLLKRFKPKNGLELEPFDRNGDARRRTSEEDVLLNERGGGRARFRRTRPRRPRPSPTPRGSQKQVRYPRQATTLRISTATFREERVSRHSPNP